MEQKLANKASNTSVDRLTRFKVGQNVRLKGLVSVEGLALNGCCGCIVELSQVDALGDIRYRIKVSDRLVVIREKNVEGVDPSKRVTFTQDESCDDSIYLTPSKGLPECTRFHSLHTAR